MDLASECLALVHTHIRIGQDGGQVVGVAADDLPGERPVEWEPEDRPVNGEGQRRGQRQKNGSGSYERGSPLGLNHRYCTTVIESLYRRLAAPPA